ncbi:hypothetical protein [Paratractidigestivibacter sp.]|uniref:hypothetical protein n=1 Tax=Paratractidigestivibacter sp. TaxID=2847316 RepID=UPI0040298E9D
MDTTKLIAQTVRGPKFITIPGDGWAVEPFTWTNGGGSRRYGLAAVNEASSVIDGYIDDLGDVAWGLLYEERKEKAWDYFIPMGLDVDAGQAPDPTPVGFAECCEVLAATMGLLCITADGQQLWAITSADDDIDENEDI